MSDHEVTITANGSVYRAVVQARTLLVHFLREQCGLTGTHVGCDTSSCGACTVMVDGATVKSCTVLAVTVDESSVLTVEGLAEEDGGLSPVQRGFQECHGLQCGYCTPGMVMAASGLLVENPDPDSAAVRHGIEGNLCRCTGYQMIVDSVRWAAANGGPGHAVRRHIAEA